MHADEIAAIHPAAPPVGGLPDIAQGVYGRRGNLELIAPHADDGFVVLWFNGDDVDARSGAARRRWSAGLHVRTGGRLDGARIAQVPHGPDFLEALLRRGETVERWIWSPGDGFVPRGAVGRSTAEPSRPVADEEGLHVLTAVGDGVVHRVARTGAYPDLDWHEHPVPGRGAPVRALDAVAAPDGIEALVVRDDGAWRMRRPRGGAWSEPRRIPGSWRTARLADPSGAVVGITADGAVVADGVHLRGRLDAVAAVRSTLDGGTLEVVGRAGDALLTARLAPGAAGAELVALAPEVWASRG